jgi:glycosyltransferase involved in cell wall biosynthesis
MRVLIVTYHFPPDAEVGGVRPLQIARHLPKFGIEPWVLTVEPRFAESPNDGLMPIGVPEDRILRTHVNKTPLDRLVSLRRRLKWVRQGDDQASAGNRASPVGSSRFWEWARHWLGFPDPRFGWYRPAVRAADEAMRRVGFDAVLSTSPPRVAAFIAAELARRHGLPWVMDLRDPWWGLYPTLKSRDRQSATVAFLQDRLFRRSVTRASLVVHNTERMRELTCRMLPDAASKTRCIPNGCDTEWHAQRTGSRPTSFRIGYYGHIMANRSATVFLQGLRLWLDSARPDPLQTAVRFVGSGFAEVARQGLVLGLSQFIQLTPPVPRLEVPAQIEGDFVLLLIANGQPLQIPGKAYEYLAAGRRILALTDHDGATADLVSSQQGCIVAEGASEVRAALEAFYQEYRGGADAWIDRSTLLADLEYGRRVEQFAELLREIVPS